MRGLPGSGKSTRVSYLIKNLNPFEYIVCSNDHYPGYYNSKGKYEWTPKKAKEAAKYCRALFEKSLSDNIPIIIIDNTNLSSKVYSYYKDKAEANGYEVTFETIEPDVNKLETYAARNEHNVSLEMLKQMLLAWEH